MGTVAAVIGEYPKHLSSHPKMNSESLKLRGTLRGHNGWVTQIATNPKFPDMILSASRDKTLIVWKLTREENNFGVPQKRLYGHSHFVSDVVLSSDGHFALSGSWDKTLRLWDLSGKSTRRFEDHTKDVRALLSPLTTVKSFLAAEIRPSSCGTPLPSASTPSRKKVTPTGSRASILPQQQQPRNCFMRLGQHGQGLELGQLPTEEEPR